MRRLPALVAAIVVLGGCAVETALPEQLDGSYTTSDGRYADCYLELSGTRLAYRTAAGSVENHRITKVRREGAPGTVLYTVVYVADDGRETELAFRVLPGSDSLTLRNLPGVTWSRVPRTHGP